jgi:Ca2+/Na+ antiporter
VLRVILLGVAMDAIYQVLVFGRIYPGELIVVVLLLAFVPYVLFRGPANRLAALWMRRHRGA